MKGKLKKICSICLMSAALTACQTSPAPQTSGSSSQAEETSTAAETTKNAGTAASEGTAPTQEKAEMTPLEQAVADAILTSNSPLYSEGECQGEGHIILDTEVKNGKTTVYALTMYGAFGFEDGNFVKTGGTGGIPAVIIFNEGADGTYDLADYQLPLDGSLYEGSIRQMFPAEFQNRCLSPSDQDVENLQIQERNYAESYLKTIGREAAVGDFGDFDHMLLTDAGVSVEVSNRMAENKHMDRYPFWIGNRERLEDGVRYVYQMDYNKGSQLIIFTKSSFETGDVVEKTVYDALTGDPVDGQDAEKTGGTRLQKVRAVIETIDGRRILVSVDDGETLKDYAERIYFDLDSQNQSIFQEGDHVEITHDGSFLESDPPIGNMNGITKIQ